MISVFDIFKIGIGPSSSHTVGPMLAAKHFLQNYLEKELQNITAIKIKLYGSLALTGIGHGSDRAVVSGLQGYSPESISSEVFEQSLCQIKASSIINLAGNKEINCNPKDLIEFISTSLPLHPNGLTIEATLNGSAGVISQTYYSVGGGFIIDGNGKPLSFAKTLPENLPNMFLSGHELLTICENKKKSIAEVVLENELTIRSVEEIRSGIDKIWQTMNNSIEKGCATSGKLPGGLNVKRRAQEMFDKLNSLETQNALSQLDYLSCYALAVNEENASFGRVVTAPTNGAAGVIPATLKFYLAQLSGKQDKIYDFFLTATAIAFLFKHGASLSAAEMGCQGEIGVAASMAAAALTAIQSGTPMQVENAAEIAIEHSLGLTCDPIGGLVQIPCIERNAIGAAKAVTSSQLALKSDGTHHVSLDQAISAMKKTGIDMHNKYKETSTGGLAISVAAPEC